MPIFAIPLKKGPLDVAQLVAHLVRDQEVAGSSPVIQTTLSQALAETQVLFFLLLGCEKVVKSACFNPIKLCF